MEVYNENYVQMWHYISQIFSYRLYKLTKLGSRNLQNICVTKWIDTACECEKCQLMSVRKAWRDIMLAMCILSAHHEGSFLVMMFQQQHYSLFHGQQTQLLPPEFFCFFLLHELLYFLSFLTSSFLHSFFLMCSTHGSAHPKPSLIILPLYISCLSKSFRI